MTIPRLSFFVAVAFTLPAIAPAQSETPPSGSPAAVADSFLTRIARKDFLAATDLIDSVSLADYHREQIRNLWLTDSLRKEPRRPRTDMPAVVAEYFEAQARKYEATFGSYIEQEFGVKTIAEAERMPARAMLARLFSNHHPETQVAQALRAQGRDSLAPLLISAFGAVRAPTVIGTILASDSLAYALFQGDTSQTQGLGPQVLPVRRTRAGWRILASEAAFTIRGTSCSFAFGPIEPDKADDEDPPRR